MNEVCTFDRGLTYSKSDEVSDGGTPVLRANNIDLPQGRLELTDIRYVSDSVSVAASKRARKDAILICTASGSKEHLGKVAYIDDAIGWAFGGFMAQISATPSIEPRYLYHLLRSERFRSHLGRRADGVNINNLKFSDIADFPVPLPPLPEQKRIVAILDEAFDGIAKATANAERNLAGAQDLFEGYLADIFSRREADWEDRQLLSICDKITVGHVGPMAQRYVEDGIPFLRSQNVRPFRIDPIGLVYIDDAFHRELGKSSLRAGDVAIVRTGYPGTAAVVPEDFGAANCADLVIVRPGPRVDPHFLAAFFNSSFGKTAVNGRLVGAAQKHFNVKAAKETILHLPPLSTQQSLIDAMHDLRANVGRLEQAYIAKRTLLDELRSSMLHRAFSGQLTTRAAA